MKNIGDILDYQVEKMEECGCFTVFVAVDWHDTLVPAFSSDEYALYPFAEEALKILSDRDDIKLILSSHTEDSLSEAFIHGLREKFGINFNSYNENKDKPTEIECVNQKFYYNVLIDDKAGFDPKSDWWILYCHLMRKDNEV